ncbi:chaperone NapD [Thalassotalea sp. 1_MG-2023]|uniref:chaperone NapD n=1 Tax=Thalassotalea sp. 1_MG-2023 TaxID=3062680 RepID=UPI0026E13B3D|nr:chaperone NapD [Thalassotalea sp. 1_MG-2023]MDO6428100.1 chaperone NapD [Thalassotalea sp. 1_MG-2023]
MKTTNSKPTNNGCPESTEYHIASFVAHIIPQQTDAFSQDLEAQKGVQVHAISDDGKVVFTVEAQHQKHIAFVVEQFRNFIGLYSLSPVYHQFITEE